MTLTYGFFDSIAQDRQYNAKQMGQLFDGIIVDGVFGSLGDKLMVVENTGMQVGVGTGRAWFNSTWSYNDAEVLLTVSTADALLPRIDVVYLEINEDVGTRANSFGILAGTPASTPAPTALTNTSTVHQYPLAHIYVGAAVTSIVQANITNKVGLTETPFVTGPLSMITTNEILAQWEAEWDDWFLAIQGQLTTEAETNLQAQIWDLAGVASGAPPYADDMVSLAAHDHSGAHSQVPTAGIEDSAITVNKIGTGAVTNAKLGTNSVSSDKILNSAVITDKINALAVTNAKLAALSVTADKIANSTITEAKIAANAVNTTQIKADAVTADKIPNRTRRIWVPITACSHNGTLNYEGAFVGVEMPNTSSTTKIYGSFVPPGDKKVNDGSTMYVLWRPLTNLGNVRFHTDYYVTDYNFYMLADGQYYLDNTVTAPSSTSRTQKSMIGVAQDFYSNSTNGCVFSIWRDHDHSGDTNTGIIVVYGFFFEYEAEL